MTRIRCNSCGTTWQKPKPQDVVIPHVCPTEVIDQHAKCDPATGKVIEKATYKPIENPRNENFITNPGNPGEHLMISEGTGVTEVE